MNKKLMLGALALVMLAGCGSANTGTDEVSETDSDTTAAETSTEKTGTAEIVNDGVTTKADVTVDGDKITAVTIDEVDDEGLSKKDLGDDYGMKAASTIEKEWYEQVEYLENYILENGVSGIELDDKGYAENEDLKSGCTISINTMVEAVKEAEENAK